MPITVDRISLLKNLKVLSRYMYIHECNYAERGGGCLFILCLIILISYKQTNSVHLQHFEDLVAGHFRHLAHHILGACKGYVEGAVVGSKINDRQQNQLPDSSAQTFKKSVARMMGLLIAGFTKNGSTDLEQYRVPV